MLQSDSRAPGPWNMQIHPNIPPSYPYLPVLGRESGEVSPGTDDRPQDAPALVGGDRFERSSDGDEARYGGNALFGAATDLPGQGSVSDGGHTASLPGNRKITCPLCGEAHDVSFHSIGAQRPGEADATEAASGPSEVPGGPPSALPGGDRAEREPASRTQEAGAPAPSPSGAAGAAELEDKERDRPSIGVELTAQDKERVDYLQKRDREVRAHEQAHVAAGGQYVRGGAQYQYESGPDGRRYAVGGEVSIDTSRVSGDARGTIRKAQAVRRAALAPADPSTQDYRAAASASRIEAEARRDLAEERVAEAAGAQGNEASEGADESSEGRLSEAEEKGTLPDQERKVPALGSDEEDTEGIAPLEGGLETPELSGVLDTKGLVDTEGLVVEPGKGAAEIEGPGPDPDGPAEPSPPEPAVPTTARLDISGNAHPGQMIDLYG